MLGALWVLAVWVWPTWRLWSLCLFTYVVAIVLLHACIIAPFANMQILTPDWDYWWRWGQREAPLTVFWTATSAAVVGFRRAMRKLR